MLPLTIQLYIGALVYVVMVIVLAFITYCFYLNTLSEILKLCEEKHRKMTPTQVWIVLVPFLGVLFHFFVVINIADTIAAQFKARNLPLKDEKPGVAAGIAFMIMACLCWVPVIGTILSIGTLMFWIIYWTQMWNYKKQLEQEMFPSRRKQDEDG